MQKCKIPTLMTSLLFHVVFSQTSNDDHLDLERSDFVRSRDGQAFVYVYLQISIYLVISPWKYPVALEIVYNLLDVKIRIQVPFLRA